MAETAGAELIPAGHALSCIPWHATLLKKSATGHF